jgi:hypothetical protein
MTFANPIFLWSLLGLFIPVAIHLLSRKEGQIIRIGSIRNIRETSTQQFKGFRLNEVLLLALRSAMIFVLTLLLSELQCSSSDKKWVVVERGLETQPSVKKVVDSLKNNGHEFHWLASNFPTNSYDSSSVLNYWELLECLNTKSLTSAVVFAKNRFENFNGERAPLSPHINWISVPMDRLDTTLIQVNTNKDSVLVRTGHFSSSETAFTSRKIRSSNTSYPPDTVCIALVAGSSYTYDKRIIMAALNTVASKFSTKLKITDARFLQNTKVDWCIWLSDDEMAVHNVTRAILMRPSKETDLIVQDNRNDWHLTKRLNEEIALDENLTLRLAELIVPSSRIKEIARKNDRRAMPDSLAWSSSKNVVKPAKNTSSADSSLVICLIALLLAERIIAYRKLQ